MVRRVPQHAARRFRSRARTSSRNGSAAISTRNTGFDEIVYEVITAGGSTFSNPPANYYRIARDPTSLAETTAQLFFGIRMQCAKCHNHPVRTLDAGRLLQHGRVLRSREAAARRR